MLWGDSHAASLFPGLARNEAGASGRPALAQYTKARCPPLLTLPPGTSRGCAEANAFVLRQVQRTRPATVVLGGYWSLYGSDPQGLPTWRAPLPRVLLMGWRASGELPERSRAALDPCARVLDEAVRGALVGSGARFISPMDLLCNASECLVTQRRDGGGLPGGP